MPTVVRGEILRFLSSQFVTNKVFVFDARLELISTVVMRELLECLPALTLRWRPNFPDCDDFAVRLMVGLRDAWYARGGAAVGSPDYDEGAPAIGEMSGWRLAGGGGGAHSMAFYVTERMDVRFIGGQSREIRRPTGDELAQYIRI